MNRTISLLLLASVPLLAACGGAKMVVTGRPIAPKAPLRLTAVASPGSDFARQFVQELVNRGYGILDTDRTKVLLSKLNLENSELTEEGALAELKARRIDSILKVTADSAPGHLELLDKVRVAVTSTDGGELLASFEWTNAWGGQPGSLADMGSRLNIPNAARAVADILVRQIGAPGQRVSAIMDDLNGRRPVSAAVAPRPAPVAVKSEPSSDVDAPARRGAERPDDFALVIGVENYQSLPKADFGERDAETVRRHLAAIGVPERNIITLAGSAATGSKLKSYLQQWLPRNVKPTSTLFVYYSGHGAPDPSSGEAYLVPWDADPMFLETSAYPLKQFYKELAAIKAKRVIVALDACFSGSGGRSVLAKGARPLVAKVDDAVPAGGNLTVLAAASGSEITGSLDEQGHGIFTYYFLKGLASGAKTPRALFDYLKPRVQDDARRQNREQSPTLAGTGADGAF